VRPAALAVAVFAVAAFGLAWLTEPAGAQNSPTTTIVPIDDQEQPRSPSIIPLPNSGSEPAESGDPGSAAQYGVLVITMGGLVVIGLLVARESRRKRDQRTPSPS
jgi:hypothetical protein